MDITICMVSLNCWTVLKDCLDSLEKCQPRQSIEVIIVDNGSTDNTVKNVQKAYEDVIIIENHQNVGFTKATNQAIRASRGDYILWLNTDTILRPDSLHKLWSFLREHGRIGIVGPMVLNGDGSFQPQCRRGLPDVMASLCYFAGLDRLFPRSRTCGQYLLTYLPVQEAASVTAVSGCCLMARRKVYEEIGPLDEGIFGFGEDIDWCYRAVQAGWEVYYYPKSVIVHLKGMGGTHSMPLKKVWAQYQAMSHFYGKHLSLRHTPLTNLLVRCGIKVSYALAATKAIVLRGINRPRLTKRSSTPVRIAHGATPAGHLEAQGEK